MTKEARAEKHRIANRRYAKTHPDRMQSYARKYYAVHRDRLNARRREMHNDRTMPRRAYTPYSIETIMLRGAKHRAAKAGLPFNLSLADIVVPAVCPILGIPLIPARGPQGCRNNNSPTLDRVIPSLGYVTGNVFVVSWRANRIKSDASIDELRRIVSYLARHAV